MIVLIIVFQMIIAVRDSVKDIPKETYYILRCLGTRKWREFKEITLPASLSSILSSIRIALG
ncbi:ABC transporter permease subunit [Niallia circulans]|nr:ABC transporter permease subunit [Niallia circulans]